MATISNVSCISSWADIEYSGLVLSIMCTTVKGHIKNKSESQASADTGSSHWYWYNSSPVNKLKNFKLFR